MNPVLPNEPYKRRISEKGWVVIPQELREKYGLKKGSIVRFVDYGGVLSIVPVPRNPVKEAFGMFRGLRLTQRLLEERKRDKEMEP